MSVSKGMRLVCYDDMSKYCKVVIIDDEFIMRQGMKHMLDWEKEGYHIVGEATNGKEGLEMAERLRPDIILADIVMPVLDGLEFSRLLKRRFPEIQLVILSSYDKFEYVKQTLMNGAADYILKPSLNPEVLLDTLNRVAERIPGMEIRRTQQVSYVSSMERYLKEYSPSLDESVFAEVFPHTLYRVVGINIRKACQGQKAWMAELERACMDFFKEKHASISIPVFMEEEYLCFVLNYRVRDEKTVTGDLWECMQLIRSRREGGFLVVSNSFSGMQKIREYYKEEVLAYIDRKFYYPDHHILFVEKRKTDIREKRFSFETYSTALFHRQFGTAIEMIQEYIEYMCQIQVEEERLKNLTKNLVYNLLMETEEYGVSVDELKKAWFSRIDRSESAETYRETVDEIILELWKLKEEKLESEDFRLMEIKNYINIHFGEALELADIAEKFGFNYHYLSSWFNRQSREGFSEYLNKVRIDKACAMLRNSLEMSIAEIGTAVGYTDQSYFSRVFKKLTGFTPSAYRRRSINGGHEK